MNAIQTHQVVSSTSSLRLQSETDLAPEQAVAAADAASIHVLPSRLDRPCQAWRRLMAEDRATEDLFEDIFESITRASWIFLGYKSFEEFCVHYLESDVDRVSEILERRFGKVRYQLLVVAESRQGHRTDLDSTSRHDGAKSPGLRTESRTRSALVAFHNAPGLEELRHHEVLTWNEAAQLGGKGLSPEQRVSVRELGLRAKHLTVLGRNEARKEVRRAVEEILGKPKPKKSPLTDIVGMNDELLREALATIPIERLRTVLPAAVLESQALPNSASQVPSPNTDEELVDADEEPRESNEIGADAGELPDVGDDDASDEPVELIAQNEPGASITPSVIVVATTADVEPAPVVVEDPVVEVESPSAAPSPPTMSDSEGRNTDYFTVSPSTWALLENAPRRAMTTEDLAALGLKDLDPDVEIVELADETTSSLDELVSVGAFMREALSCTSQVVRKRASRAQFVPLSGVNKIDSGAVCLYAYGRSFYVQCVGLGKASETGNAPERVWVLTKGANGNLAWLFGSNDSSVFGKSLDGWVTR